MTEKKSQMASITFRLPADLIAELKIAALWNAEEAREKGKKTETIGVVVTRAIRVELDKMIKNIS